MNRQELISLGQLALEEAFRFANQKLVHPISSKNCLHGIYWQSDLGQIYTFEEALDRLMEDGAFPAIVDLTIRGSLEGKPICIWIPSGHPKVRDLEKTWNEGFGPFKPMGLLVPSHLGDSSPLTEERMELIGQDWLKMREEESV